ncbi:hypothetical protein JQC67_13060 [Aurantibacter crassamenti]|uniref:hypothetical protein n=1 Tax=Aurantibacter crassamenti TaxID=1837375 RepID=UPI0019393FD9|nr:hypothetical protein [Aurantibacter crassamenti]MBM1107075.1 hypothetical protein [Aurantibacter crassamenti]
MGTHNRTWYQKKRTWFLLVFLICLGLFISTLPKELPRNLAYLAKAYAEPEIAEGALAIAKKDPKIIALLGELEPMHTFDMIEGSVGYSKTGDSVAITIGVRGDKKEIKIRSNMDVLAEKINGKWEYLNIQVRVKNPIELKQTIPILKK